VTVVPKWTGCYDDGWKGLITSDSFSHPAKFSKGLIERIYDYCLEQGWLTKGDLVGDPFAGIGTGGIVAAYRGLRWVGLELEPKFVKLAKDNFRMHADRFATLQVPHPRIIQGDSRRFDEYVQASAVVTSPPFVDSMSDTPSKQILSGSGGRMGMSCKGDNYGQSPGQIGQLKSGDIDAVVTSPPFSAPNMQPCIGQGVRKDLIAAGKSPETNNIDYRDKANIETLKAGDVDAVVTSPPYAKALENKSGIDAAKVKRPGGPHGNTFHANYGQTPGQIEGLKNGTVDGVVNAGTCPVCGCSLQSDLCNIPVKTVESGLREGAGGANLAPENTSAHRSKDALSPNGGKRKLRKAISTFQIRCTTQKGINDGRAAATVGGDMHGESKGEKPSSVTIIGAQIAAHPRDSSFIMRKTDRPLGDNGITAQPISKHSAEAAIAGATPEIRNPIKLCAKCAASDLSQDRQPPPRARNDAKQHSTPPSTTDGKPEDYWSAMHKVYGACYRAIKPGGIMAVVVKDYVKDRKIVPLCDDTVRLLEYCGLTLIERVHAMLTQEYYHNDLFERVTVTRKERKSFFRRLAEKNGSPRIDWEEVIFCCKSPYS